jgi:uncharacterized YigZ family protein
MSDTFTYRTITSETVSDFRDRGSKFFGYAFPVDSVSLAKQKLQQLKKQHPKANHHCYAWRIGQLGEECRSSDDGEPSGSAGKPIEGQILSRKLTNVMVVVVRYFGGTLLGVPGLIHAYRTAAAEALESAGVEEHNIEYRCVVQFNYNLINEVMIMVRQFSCRIHQQDNGLYCTWDIRIPLANKDRALQGFTSLHGLEIMQNV